MSRGGTNISVTAFSPHALHSSLFLPPPTSQQHITPLDAVDVSACAVTSEVIDVGLQE